MLGYLPERAQVRPESPLAVASFTSLFTLVAGVICQFGMPWHEARVFSEQCAQDTMLAAFDPTEIHPKGNVALVLHQLVQAGIQVALVTSDDRSMTENTLSLLGISEFVSIGICGDDPVPNKPAPEAIWQISAQLGIEPGRMMVVGDTVNDMRFAQNAGVAYRVGVALNQNPASLEEQADVVVSSIDEFIIMPRQNK